MRRIIHRSTAGVLVGYVFAVLTGIVAVIFLGGMACTSTREPAAVEKINVEVLNNSIAYIKSNHPDAAAFLADNIAFTVTGSTGKDIEGYTGVTYSGGGWTVSIGHAIVPNYAYDIKADYGNGKIVWVGTSKNGQVKEESYTRLN